MGIIDANFEMPGKDFPPQTFLKLGTQQGQINWLAQFVTRINKTFDTVSATITTLPVGSDPYVNVDFDPNDYSSAFEFGIPEGVEVESIALNDDYTLTFTYNDGTQTTLGPIRGAQGETGPQGPQGETGAAAGFGIPTATIDANVGTPGVTVTASGPDTAKVFSFDFTNLKGETGSAADPGSVGTTELADGGVTLAKLNSDVVSVLNGKAGLNGMYPGIISGGAIAVESNPLEGCYLYRSLDVVPDLGDGVAGIEVIKGNTLTWNQLANVPDYTMETEESTGYRFRNLLYTSSSDDRRFYMVEGHKYLVKSDITLSGDTTVCDIQITTTATEGYLCTYNQQKQIITAASNYLVYAQARFKADSYPADIGGSVNKLQIFDLTTMFGAGNEPATVAEFEALFPDTYYAYDAGSLLNVNMLGIESVGFNQWDEQWELGSYDTSTGEPRTSTTQIRSVGYISVFPSTQYYMYTAGFNTRVLFYDADGTWIPTSTPTVNNSIFTTPSNCAQVRFHCASNYGTVYNHDICINFSDPSRNGTYEPYNAHELEIPVSDYFANGMRSAGSARDALYSNHYDTVIGVVDLGSLTWSYVTSGANPYFSASVSGLKRAASSQYPANVKCAKYDTVGIAIYQDKSVSVSTQASTIYVFDSTYTDAATFQTAMSGVYLYYELATPTTTPINPPLNLTYAVEHGGTERVLVDETADAPQSVPPVFETRYPLPYYYQRDKALAVIAPVEVASSSSDNYAIGSFVIVDGLLYKVTSAIATGEAFVVGTNITQTTVMSEILAL